MSEVTVYDDEDGIVLEFWMADGISTRIYLTDETAESMIMIVQNKLNERWKP